MSFLLEALRDKPLAIHLLDDTSPFQDYSGYGAAATLSGTDHPVHMGIVSGASSSRVLSSSSTASFAVPLWRQGLEGEAWTAEAWLRALSVDGTYANQQVFGNTGYMDGLCVNGTVVTFTIRFANSTSATATHDIQQHQKIHAVGVYTPGKISLYVNSVLVAEQTITEEQQVAGFSTTPATKSAGSSAGTQRLALAGVSFYAEALSQEAISRHHAAGIALPSLEDVASSNNGDTIDITLSSADLFLDQWWSTADEWSTGILDNVAIRDDRLVPQFDGETSIAGQWRTVFPLAASADTTVFGVSANWDGVGLTIEASVDGTNWIIVQRGVNLSIIPPGFVPTNKQLEVRVVFPGGIVDDTSFIDNLNFVGIKTPTAPTVPRRVVSFVNAYQERDYPPLSLHDDWGVEISAGGSITVSADVSGEPVPVRTIEFWAKGTTSTVPSLSVSGTNYQNGILDATNHGVGEWVLYHVVLPANHTGQFVVTGPAQVGGITVYPVALSASQVSRIYNQHIGKNTLQVVDSSAIRVQESAVPVKVYEHDWAIESTG